jgi:adenylate cyclase
MEPERLAFFINTYLTEMANIAIEHGGTIDKFIGDAVLVFLGILSRRVTRPMR